MSWPTIFTFLFALACLATFVFGAFGAKRQWQDARIASAVVAIMSFLMALLTASIGKHH
jgi:VIT1/CCC1 family predicted Fe2+/Mn2+ transporter